MFTRRQFSKAAALAALAAGVPSTALAKAFALGQQAQPRGAVNGVTLGASTYSFRGIPRPSGGDYIDTMVDACVETGATEVEVMARLAVQPEGLTDREAVRQWRLTVPESRFREIHDKFARRGIRTFSYLITFDTGYTDGEIDAAMRATKAMNANVMGLTMVTVPMLKRLATFAERHQVVLAFHNRPAPDDPNEISGPDAFQRVLDTSDNFRIILDIGHYTAANEDVLAALERFHQRISHVHLKDRKKGVNGGANLPWGEGDTPLRETLRLIRDKRWPIPAIVEYEHPGKESPQVEVKRCIDYAKAALLS